MTDVRTLLRTASPPPPPSTIPISRMLDAARDRQRSRRRRFWLWAGAVLVVAGGGPATDALVHASRSSSHVRTTPARRGLATTPTTVANSDAFEVRATPGPRSQPESSAKRGANPSAAGDEAPALGAEGCRVDERSTSNVQLSDTGVGGAGWDAYPSCSYTASRPGGYVAKGSWRIEITRGGNLLTVESAHAPACAQDVIQPGDAVTVYLRKGVNSPDDWFIAVGANERCAT